MSYFSSTTGFTNENFTTQKSRPINLFTISVICK